jgi:hypothetical protein
MYFYSAVSPGTIDKSSLRLRLQEKDYRGRFVGAPGQQTVAAFTETDQRLHVFFRPPTKLTTRILGQMRI